MFGGSSTKYTPPPPPEPPANPPTYASAMSAGPSGSASLGRFGGLASSILTGPMGAPESGATKRKSLFGQ